jgi:crotonobetaine/carnitine-CoA ligase
MAGYFKNPEASTETIRDGWLYTGDNAVRDEDGYYRFVDRKKDMIKRSGENVSAGEVENVVLQHPAVFECAVIGLPDEIEFCAGKLAGFRVPQRVVFEESLPKTSVGKIQKHLIRAGLASGDTERLF